LGREALLALAAWVENKNEKNPQVNPMEWEAVPPEQQTHLISLLGRIALKQIKQESIQEEVGNESILPFAGKQNSTTSLRSIGNCVRSSIHDTTDRKTFGINQATICFG